MRSFGGLDHFAASIVFVYNALFCNIFVAKWRTFASVHMGGPLYFSTLRNSGPVGMANSPPWYNVPFITLVLYAQKPAIMQQS